jgi:hypothetical protein
MVEGSFSTPRPSAIFLEEELADGNDVDNLGLPSIGLCDPVLPFVVATFKVQCRPNEVGNTLRAAISSMIANN